MGPPTVLDMHHPWRGLRALAGWTLEFAPLPEGQTGETCYESRTITLTTGMTQAERRSTIAHEVIHAERPEFLESLRDKEERWVAEEAARRLIRFDHLIDALRWARNLHELAEELWVDEDTVRVRLAYLHPSERTKIDALREELTA